MPVSKGQREVKIARDKAMISMHKKCKDIQTVCNHFGMAETTVSRIFRANGYFYKVNKYARKYHFNVAEKERTTMTHEENFCREQWNNVLSQAW